MEKHQFKPVSSQVDFVEIEKRILDGWYSSGLVEKYLHKNDKATKKFRFLDGPITANNPMGIHHAQGRVLKDLFQRFKNAQGYRQRFQNGFDCQGLWLEVQEERDLGLNSKRDIEKFGIEKFCIRCRQRVEKYSAIQTEQSKRLGMFMDWNNSYYTMSETNNVYIWYFLKKCHERGWLYKGVDSMPWCPRCGTAISKHELSDDGYKTVEHTSVYVKLPLKKQPNTYLLIWTTTPWTLTVNVAVAVNPAKTYVKVSTDSGEFLILAKNRLSVLTESYDVVDELTGEELVGENYKGPFDELPTQSGVTHCVIAWDEVSDEEGSGLVHIAPGAGEEDFQLGKKYKLSVLAPLDEFGVFIPEYGQFTGKFALDVKDEVFVSLKSKGLFYKTEKIVHSYPHCWRCKHELIFRATHEWFIEADEIRPLMKKAAKKAVWLPDSAEKRMQDWLNNMGDWPISRRRYWGLALPFYECSCGELVVVGSKNELRELAVDKKLVGDLKELHRPWIDEIKIKCPQCHGEAARVKEVGDCWLDAGIVPFSTLKYLEGKTYWQEWFPSDFVSEYVAQIKLWFYATLFMSVTLEGVVPWKHLLVPGFIVDEKGEPMHKTKGNFIPFDEAAEKMGIDVVRWVCLSTNSFSTIENLKFGYAMGDEVRRRFLLTLWNVYSFFVTYANLDKWELSSPDSKHILDKWILARLNETVKTTTETLEKYDPYTPTQFIEKFVSDFSTWYLRRSRDRRSSDFYATTYEILVTLCKLLAPFMPFITEEIYKNLTGEESVHLASWPKSASQEELLRTRIIEEMGLVRKICELGHARRKENNIKVRQPLASLKVKSLKLDDELAQLIKDELNVKEVEFLEGKELEVSLNTVLTPELIAEGKARELIRNIQDARKEAGTGLGEKVVVHLPDWPKSFEDYIKGETLATELIKGDTLRIERNEKI